MFVFVVSLDVSIVSVHMLLCSCHLCDTLHHVIIALIEKVTYVVLCRCVCMHVFCCVKNLFVS